MHPCVCFPPLPLHILLTLPSTDVSDSVDQCPEWSRREIINYVQVYLRMGGLLALTSVVYVGAGLVAAFRLAKNLREYRCEYI